MFQGRTDKIFCTEGNLFNEVKFKKIVDRYFQVVKAAGKQYSLQNGLALQSIEQLDRQMIVPDLYVQESIRNSAWFSEYNED